MTPELSRAQRFGAAAPWFYCDSLKLGRVELDDAETRHALLSRRLRDGDAVVLFDGRGTRAAGAIRIAKSKRPCAAVEVQDVDHVPRAARDLTLCVAAVKGPRLEWMVEKLTELGVTRVVFADFARSVVRLSDRHVDKLRRTAIEACKQCERAWLPVLTTAPSLADALLGAGGDIWCDPAGAAPLVVLSGRGDSDPLRVVIGPEGGLAPSEIEWLRSRGVPAIRLGPQILRTETAAITLAGVLMALDYGSSART